MRTGLEEGGDGDRGRDTVAIPEKIGFDLARKIQLERRKGKEETLCRSDDALGKVGFHKKQQENQSVASGF